MGFQGGGRVGARARIVHHAKGRIRVLLPKPQRQHPSASPFHGLDDEGSPWEGA